MGNVTPRLLTLEEAAGRLGCSTKTLRRRIAAGLLPAFCDRGLVRIPEPALAAYVSTRTSRPPELEARRGAPASSVPPPSVRRLFDLPDPLDHPGELIKDHGRPDKEAPAALATPRGVAPGGKS
jgi:excisionase family DNA binding protein